MIPTDPRELDALAGEYVLGTLDARDAAEVAGALRDDAALRDAVAGWETRLAPLSTLALPEAPPPGLWARIEAALPRAPVSAAATETAAGLVRAPAAPPAGAPSAARRGAGWLWRFWAVGATTVAAGLAAILLVRPPPPPPPLMTVLLTSRDQPAWLVEADPAGPIRLSSLNARPVQSDRVLQLWALPQGATAPTSLGVIPSDGRVTVTPASIRPEPNMLIEISLEPPGGSPTGRPTGPVQFIGRLGPAGSS